MTVEKSIAVPTFFAPVRVGGNSFVLPPCNASRGNATDRATICHVLDICQNENALSQQQYIEMQDVKCGKQDLVQINPLILSAAGLDMHKEASGNVSDKVATVDPLVSGYGQTVSYQPHIRANTIRSSREQHRCPHNL
jgi:hypothetical protein